MKTTDIFLLTSSILVSLPAQAQISANVQYTDRVFMRGEQISESAIEVSVTKGIETPFGDVYAGIYRLTPVGDRKSHFFEEFDYMLGYVHQGEGYTVDLSASWLTFPGSPYESMVEVVGRSSFDAPLQPTLTAFYNDGLRNAGLELTAGPEHAIGIWTLYGLGRVGFVVWKQDQDPRSYAGIEMGIKGAVTGPLQLLISARHEVANQDAYVRDIHLGGVIQKTDSGTSLRVSLATSF